MAITAGNTGPALAVVLLSLALSGCGLTQKMVDSTVTMTKSVFYKQVKTLHLDIRAREAVNRNAGGIPLSTVLRIYQLKDRQAFDSTDYPSLFADDSQSVEEDVVAQKDIRLLPGGAVMVDMLMDDATQYVAVAAMFIAPDQDRNTWRLVLSRNDLDPDIPRLIEAGDNQLALKPLESQ
ncbi:type VI secretion system lipoprotein TssJ [Kosakonia sp.]|uniref:type VI secretion system lipoprotein TssJ n=1 Tax=Kosakonia sp. TaxID=1916651 RepID=UPI00390C4189